MKLGLLSSKPSAFSIVVATTLTGGIGWKGGLPWRLPKDMRFFLALTTKVNTSGAINAVIMGRKTYESLPQKFKPLPKRLNLVISKSWSASEKADAENKTTDVNALQDSMMVVSSLDAALHWIAESPLAKQVENVFVIGGGQIYEEALKSDKLAAIYMTRVTGVVECDCFVEAFKNNGGTASIAVGPSGEPFVPVAITKTFSSGMLTYDFVEYRSALNSRVCRSTHFRNCLGAPAGSVTCLGSAGGLESLMEVIDGENAQIAIPCIGNPLIVWRGHEEFQYLDLVAQIIAHGVDQADRTGVGTRALFGAQMRFDLRSSFPLLTTKSVFWRGVVEELLWFIRGDTNSKRLSEKGVKIWDANGSREFLDSVGFYDREEGDLGPVYGFQWRHFGAEYLDAQQDYMGQGIDQLEKAIELLKTDPYSRRIIISAWNPAALHKMALPPCHMFCQFFVTPSKHLSCIMYQRSGDMGLGVPFNIASYSLLCCIMAQVCGLIPGEFIHVIGNAHIYLNHIEPLKAQLERIPRPFPFLHIDPAVKDINQLDASNFKLIGYMPHPKIPMQFAV